MAKEKTLIPLPWDTSEEMAEILDANFDYQNNVDFGNPKEFTDKYGQEIYDKTIEIFKEKWFANLGEAIEYGFPSFEECIKEAQEKTDA